MRFNFNAILNEKSTSAESWMKKYINQNAHYLFQCVSIYNKNCMKNTQTHWMTSLLSIRKKKLIFYFPVWKMSFYSWTHRYTYIFNVTNGDMKNFFDTLTSFFKSNQITKRTSKCSCKELKYCIIDNIEQCYSNFVFSCSIFHFCTVDTVKRNETKKSQR